MRNASAMAISATRSDSSLAAAQWPKPGSKFVCDYLQNQTTEVVIRFSASLVPDKSAPERDSGTLTNQYARPTTQYPLCLAGVCESLS
jgi:hypothetical protein